MSASPAGPSLLTVPVVVLGFGRSGTTWIADIISRTSGKLVLFEPFHPSVTADSRDLSYGPLSDGMEQQAADFLHRIVARQIHHPWLLRNHVPRPLAEIDGELLELLWRECEVLGYKEIRQNFQIEWIAEHISRRIAFVIRHPYGVVSSILRRANFWEFGWPGTFELLMSKTVFNERYDSKPIAGLRSQARKATTDLERISLMWTAVHLEALPALRSLGITPHNYTDFLVSPFTAARKLLADLAIESDVHPAQLFLPSLTAEPSAVARRGVFASKTDLRSEGMSNPLGRRERMLIDRIVEPMYDLIDLGAFNERAVVTAGA